MNKEIRGELDLCAIGHMSPGSTPKTPSVCLPIMFKCIKEGVLGERSVWLHFYNQKYLKGKLSRDNCINKTLRTKELKAKTK